MISQILSKLPDWITALSTFALCIVAFFQLKGLKDSNTLQIVFDIERELYDRKRILDELTLEIQQQWQNNIDRSNSETVSILEAKLLTSKEDYFNALERLAFLILQKYLQERKWKDEYKDLIIGIVKQYENRFGAATPYTNILSLYKRWR